ncbi:hypothetical protein [Rosenbergiella nectarea]|uniref:hypothetical protein n=1 Tax=Rosenbergiella nectarea TaxID=988801 RepID=UPI001F4F075C|nr:hypothetical protein [Rosenbergiella nectarea]
MGTVFTLKGVNFNNAALPSISPFVAKPSLLLGYSFQNRNFTDEVSSQVARTFTSPLKGTATTSNTIPKATSDNLGVDINEACIDAFINAYTLKADGTTPITFMVVANRNGEALSSGQTASPYLAPLINWGNSFDASAGLMLQFSSTGKFGIRYNNTDEGNVKVNDNGTQPAIYFVTYDGTSAWTVQNLTAGVSATGTSAAADMKAVSTANPVQVGTKRTSDATYLLPANVYQVAAWGKVLSATEISTQAARTRKELSSLSL